MMAWALFCHDFDLSKGINILSEKCPVVLDHYTKLMWQIEESHSEIAEKGMTVVNEKGTQIDNPAFSRLEKLTRLATSLSTKLHVHAEATVGKSEDAAKRATKQRDAENTLATKDPSLDDFIARPMVN